LKHTVCLREKSTAAATCPTGPTPVAAIVLPDSQANFFMQVWTTVEGGNKDAYDKVTWGQEWQVGGDCTTSATWAKCRAY